MTTYTFKEQQCPICEKHAVSLVGRRGGEAHRIGLGLLSLIYQCKNCGLLFPDPMPIPESVSEHYGDPEKYFVEHSIENKVAELDGLLNTIEKMGVKPGRLLDIGAGRGEMLRAAKKRGWEAVGLELSETFASFAREFSDSRVVVASMEDRPFEENYFDLVTLGAVLEHVFTPKELISEIHRVLKPGGMLWLDVPNEAGAFYRLGNAYQKLRGRDWVVNLSPTFPPYHVFGFTHKAIQRLLQSTGFEIVKFETYAATSVIETHESPVPRYLRPLVRFMLRASERIGAGSYMDVWAVKR